MRIIKYDAGNLTNLLCRCRLLLHGQRVKIGESIFIDLESTIAGPFRVIDLQPRFAIVVADEDFNFYPPVKESDSVQDRLCPIFQSEYEPITGNVYLDGFLRAAHYDDKHILRVDLSEDFAELVIYYSNALNLAGIDHHRVKEGFILNKDEVIKKIFDKSTDNMPIKFIIGYLSSYIYKVKLESNRNPMHAKYLFEVYKELFADDFIVPERFFDMELKNRQIMYAIYGCFEPISKIIDSAYKESETESRAPAIISDIEVCKDVIPELIYKLFYYSGYFPSWPERFDSDNWSFRVKQKETEAGRGERTFILSLGTEFSENIYADYALLFVRGTMQITKVKKGMADEKGWHSLLYSSEFSFGAELSMYYQILLKKL